MTTASPALEHVVSPRPTLPATPPASRLAVAMEAVVLALVCLSPWAFGATDTAFELLLYLGVAVLLALWGLRTVVEGRVLWKASPVVVLLGALFLTGIAQLVPLARPTLVALSPGTARLYDALLPSEPETLPDGAEREVPASPVGRTLSLYPTATRTDLVRLLAVLALFVVVRSTIASPATLRRLALACLVNGALLTLFGLVQFFSSPQGLVYWTYETPGEVFGPFLNRNHFAWYINLCLGLGLGLLLLRPRETDLANTAADSAETPRRTQPGRSSSGRRRRRRRSEGPRSYRPEPAVSGSPLVSWAGFVTPQRLWLLFPLALLLAGLFFSLSRGAIVACVVAGAVCLLLKLLCSRRSARLAPLLVVPPVVACALLLWFGSERVTARLATLWQGNALQESRLPVWTSALPLVLDAPLCGTGLGTFGYVESLHRTNPAEAGTAYEHAHNEYLELLVETGVVGLAVGVAALGFVLWYGYRTVSRHESRSARALALGALFALTATAVHAFVEFGLHIPAIAVLVTAVCAHLCTLGASPRQARSEGADGNAAATSRRQARLLPLAAALTAVTVGLVLAAAGLRAHLVQQLLAAAMRANDDADDPDRRQHQIDYLESAVRIAPEYAQLQFELAQAHFEALEDGRHLTAAAGPVSDAAQAFLLPAGLSGAPGGELLVRAASPFGALGTLLTGAAQAREDDATKRHLVPALRHCLLARDLCPTLARPQVRLADFADRLAHGDGRGAYLRRAKLLVSFDPEIWYFSGLQELLDNHPDEAWESWHHCLRLSGDRLVDIVQRSAKVLPPAELLERLLPDDPDLLYAAALELFPDPTETEFDGPLQLDRRPDYWAGRLVLSASGGSGVPVPLDLAEALGSGYLPLSERRPFLERALALLEARPGRLPARDLYLKGRIHWALWQLGAAEAAYQDALATDGLNAEHRLEYARLLHQAGHLREARRELLLLMALPDCPAQAGRLLDVVTHDRARTQDILK